MICQRCDTINAQDAKFCCKCAGGLDIKTAMEMDRKIETETAERTSTDKMMALLMKDNEFVAMLKKKSEEVGLVAD